MTDRKFYIEINDPPAKRAILEHGLRLFATHGLSATTIRDIAEATGYSNPALYKHFRTKEALALTLFERTYRQLLAQLDGAVARRTGFAARFSAYVTAFTGFYDDDPHATIFAIDNLAVLWPEVPETMRTRTIITLTREILELGRVEGLVSKKADLNLQLTLVTGTLGQLVRQLYLGAMDGPASAYAPETDRMLRAGLT